MCKPIAWIIHEDAQLVTIRLEFTINLINWLRYNKKDEVGVETNYLKQAYSK